jgi:uncharacterized SAM-binding protein YcdF (DUF218 family)
LLHLILHGAELPNNKSGNSNESISGECFDMGHNAHGRSKQQVIDMRTTFFASYAAVIKHPFYCRGKRRGCLSNAIKIVSVRPDSSTMGRADEFSKRAIELASQSSTGVLNPMFLMKKIISRFLFPVPLSLEFLLVGLFLLWFTRRQRAGKVMATCGAVLLFIFSNIITSNALLRPLEHSYPPLSVRHSGAQVSSVGFVAVLGGLGDDDPNVPITSHIFPDLMVRLIEAVRLHREIPGSKLILSGGHFSSDGMAKMAEALGVNAEDILQLGEPLDTEEESQQVAPIVGSHPFILVTSASHMPRAMGLFQARGLQPIAAPTDFLAPHRRVEIDDLVPDGFKLFKSQLAIYEYLGLAWAKLRGKL